MDNHDRDFGPQLVFKIVSESSFIQDPLNSRFELNEGYFDLKVEERSTILNFIRSSNPNFLSEESFRLDDIAQRLKPKVYNKGHILKPFG